MIDSTDASQSKKPKVTGFFGDPKEFIKALFTALLVAFVFRSFIVEPFKIPSGSMIPTLLVGDQIFVSKWAYGLRIPFTHWWPIKGPDPKRGEVVVFIYPADESLDFIKRVVGLPGDVVRFDGTQFYVNDQPLVMLPYDVQGIDPENPRELSLANREKLPEPLRDLPYAPEYDLFHAGVETLDQVTHRLQYLKQGGIREPFRLIVPADHFFVMGDNRDFSSDSRVWGFVPRENLKGRASFIWLSWDKESRSIRLERFGKRIR